MTKHGFATTNAGMAEPEPQAAENAESAPDTLTIEYPAQMVDDRILANLEHIIEGKGKLLRKAIGTDSLAYEVTKETVKFPLFKLSGDANEVGAYTNLITKLTGLAKDSKRIVIKEK